MITAELADGRRLEFPDGTDPQVVQSTVRRLISQQPISDAQPAQIEQPEEQLPEGGALASVIEPLKTIGGSLIGDVTGGLAGAGTLLMGGDIEGAMANLTKARDFFSSVPETEEGRQGLQKVGDTVQAISEAVNVPVSGLYGIGVAVLSGSAERGFEQAERVKEVGIGRTMGETALEATESPALAALAETIPTAALEVGGALAGTRAARAAARKATLKTDQAKRAVSDIETGAVKQSTLDDVSATLKSGDVDDVAALVDADPNFYRAADELGINTEPLASFASKNPQFRDVEQALSAVPGSVIDVQAKRFISEVSQKADNLIEQYGGTLDKAQLGLDFKDQSLKTITNLFDKADNAYGDLRAFIPDRSTFEAGESVAFLKQLKEDGRLPSKFRSMLKKLEPKKITEKGEVLIDPATGATIKRPTTDIVFPKFGTIDQVRREVGQAINKRSGQFKDVEEGLNKALYAKLSRDQEIIADGIGGQVKSLSETAKGLVRQRKQIEDNLVTLYGKGLNQALNVNVAGAVKGLSKGQVDKFKSVMSAIPKNKRGEVALSAMNDVFKGTGVNQQSLSPTQFVKWYQSINRSPAAKKALFSALPKESKKAVDNLFEVSRGISRALGQKVPTGRINALFNDDTGFIRKMIASKLPSIVAFSTGSPTASVMTSATSDFLRQGSTGAQKAANLMASDKFQSIIRKSVKEGVIDGTKASESLLKAQIELERTLVYKKWAEGVDKTNAGALSGGMLGYLFEQEQ